MIFTKQQLERNDKVDLAASVFNHLIQHDAKGLEQLFDSVEHDPEECRLVLKKENHAYTFFFMGTNLCVHKDSMRGKHLWKKEVHLDIKRPNEKKYKKRISAFIAQIIEKAYELHHHSKKTMTTCHGF